MKDKSGGFTVIADVKTGLIKGKTFRQDSEKKGSKELNLAVFNFGTVPPTLVNHAQDIIVNQTSAASRDWTAMSNSREITCNRSGDYKIKYQATITKNNNAADEKVEFIAFRNGQKIMSSRYASDLANEFVASFKTDDKLHFQLKANDNHVVIHDLKVTITPIQ